MPADTATTAGVGPVELPAAGEFEILYGVPEADYRIVLDPGWNLLGSPLVTTTTAGAFLGVGLRDGALAPVWRLAPDGYAATDLDQPLPAEVGCWVYSPAGGEATDGAGLQTDGAVCLRTGWNLISPAARFSLARPGCEPLRGRTWRWDAAWQTYAPVPDDGQLEPGAAYWVYIETAGPCLTPDP